MNNGMTAKDDRPGPLTGVRIVEYGVFHAGPGAGAILGDMGADVIKIETEAGDPLRMWDRTASIKFDIPKSGSLIFEISNRNKKGIQLDIKTKKGREILNRMVKDADVFITNLRKSTKTNLGIDYASISKINPKIIHANVSGYGPEGPMSDIGAFDPLGQARSGMMFITGTEEPTLIQLGVLDQATAIAASHAILSALFARERQGIGQEIHISLYSTAIWLIYVNIMVYTHLSGNASVPWDRYHNSPLRNSFKCRDGKWILGTNHPEHKYWPILCEVTGQTALINDPRFADSACRIANCPELVAIFDEVFLTETRDEWMEKLAERKLMYSPVQTIEEVVSDPQALINDYIVNFEHPYIGQVKIPGYPAHFSANQAGIRTPAPGPGEHTDIIMQDLGYTDQEIESLKKEGIIL